MNEAYSLSNFSISNTKIYEVSAWFQSIIQKIRNSKRRLLLQDKWFDLVEQYLYHNNISTLNSSFTLYTSKLIAVQRRKLWIDFARSLMAKYRLERLQFFHLHLQNYQIAQFKNSNWVHIIKKLIATKRKEDIHQRFNSYSFSLTNWSDMYSKIILNSKKKRFLDAYQQLQDQRRSFSENQLTLNSSMPSAIPNQSFNTFSTCQTQTNYPNSESILYRNFLKLVHNYRNQKFYENLISLHNDFVKKQKQKKIRRHKQAQFNWINLSSRYKKFIQMEELKYSAESLKKYTVLWRRFSSLLHSQHLQYECQKGLYYLDKNYHEKSEQWKSMIFNILLEDKKKNCIKLLQQYREKQLQKATEFGVSFLNNKIGGVDQIVSQHYQFKQKHYQRGMPRDFWHSASQFAFSFTRTSFVESVNQAVPLLTADASRLAQDFVNCQSLLTLTNCKQYNHQKVGQSLTKDFSNRNGRSDQKNVHIIIGFGYNDTVSILDSLDLPNS